jgi:hypothetical protein
VVAHSLAAEAGLPMVVAQEGRHNLAGSLLAEDIDLGAASHIVVVEEEDIAVHTEVEGNAHAGERHREDFHGVDKPYSRVFRFD